MTELGVVLVWHQMESVKLWPHTTINHFVILKCTNASGRQSSPYRPGHLAKSGTHAGDRQLSVDNSRLRMRTIGQQQTLQLLDKELLKNQLIDQLAFS